MRSSVRLARLIPMVLLVCVVTAHAEEAPRNTKPFTRFKVLLSSAFFNDTLPFDVPFILWGDVPETSDPGALAPTSVTLRIAELIGSTDCNSVAPGDYEAPQKSDARTWTATDYADRGVPAPTDLTTSTRRQFEFMIRPLEPKRNYCFLFQKEPGRRLTFAETNALVNRLLPAYRSFLQQTGIVLTAGQNRIERLRRGLIRSLQAAGPLQEFQPIAGTVFHPETSATAAFSDFADAAALVFNSHDSAQLQIVNFNRVAAEDLRDFASLGSSAALKKAVGSLPVNDPVRQDWAFVSGLNTEQRRRLLQGLTPSAPAEPLQDVWETVEGFSTGGLPTDPCPASGPLMARCGRLDELRASLSRLASLLAGGPDTQFVTSVLGDVDAKKAALLNLQQQANDREVQIQAHLETLESSLPTSILVMTTTLGSLATRRTWYLSADTGLAVATAINEVFPYVGTNIYFRPINTEAPPGPFLSRFAVLFGFTWTSNLATAGRQALYSSNTMVLVGGGLRVTDFIRLGGGALVLKGSNANPFVVKSKIELTPYINLSADIDVAGVLGRVFGADSRPPVIGGGTTK